MVKWLNVFIIHAATHFFLSFQYVPMCSIWNLSNSKQQPLLFLLKILNSKSGGNRPFIFSISGKKRVGVKSNPYKIWKSSLSPISACRTKISPPSILWYPPHIQRFVNRTAILYFSGLLRYSKRFLQRFTVKMVSSIPSMPSYFNHPFFYSFFYCTQYSKFLTIPIHTHTNTHTRTHARTRAALLYCFTKLIRTSSPRLYCTFHSFYITVVALLFHFGIRFPATASRRPASINHACRNPGWIAFCFYHCHHDDRKLKHVHSVLNCTVHLKLSLLQI